jgi:hypothetical protein
MDASTYPRFSNVTDANYNCALLEYSANSIVALPDNQNNLGQEGSND